MVTLKASLKLTIMKLNLKHRIVAVAVVLLTSLLIGLNSCNNSTETTETKTDTSKMMQGDTSNHDSTKGGQEPPPK